MHNRLLRRSQVEEIAGLSRSSIYRRMQKGEFPRPVKIGSAAVRWKERDIAPGWSPCPGQSRRPVRPIPTDSPVVD